jgi:hypothetical protein
MWRLSHLFVIKLTLISFLVNVVLPLTFIINDRIFGFEKTGSSQISFVTLSLTFNLLIVPAYSMILVSQNLNWLVMMPVSRLRLVTFSALMRLWTLGLGILLFLITQVIMEKLYYSNLSFYETSMLKASFSSFLSRDWVVDLDWTYSTYALIISLICVILSGFVMNFDFEGRSFRFTISPLLSLVKSKFRAVVGLVIVVLFFGFISLSRANLFIMFSLALPFFLYLTANVFVLEKRVFSWIKACVVLIIAVHSGLIFFAREELKRGDTSLERSISNFEYLEIYTAGPARMAHGILNRMLLERKLDTGFIKSYFDELSPELLFKILEYPLAPTDLERLSKFSSRDRLDPYFFDPVTGLETKVSSESALVYLGFFSLTSLTFDQVTSIVSHVSRAYPASNEQFFQLLSQRKFTDEEIKGLLDNNDKYIIKFGLLLLRYYPDTPIAVAELRPIIDDHPLLLEDVYKTIIVRAGEFVEFARLMQILNSLNLNPNESCPARPSELFRLAGDKGSYRIYTLCLRRFFEGVIQPSLEQMEVIENPFYAHHLEQARSLF